jgi:hypothetical protein
MYNEREFQRYQEFMAYKANRISGDLGKVALAPFTLGIADVPTTSVAYEAKEAKSTPLMDTYYAAELGALTARNVISVDFTPREALRSAESQLTAA